MPLIVDDNITAIASPPGPAARGTVRLSGPDAVTIVRDLLDAELPDSRVPFRVTGAICSEPLGSPLPADVLIWPTSRSYTGQPMVEIHTIGSPPLLELVVESLLLRGARPAERGEFTMRAFLNGRIDLVQAEAVTGVIDAADHDELQQALLQLGGGLTQSLRQLQAEIIAVLGDLEAGLDFVEEDIEFISSDETLRRLRNVRDSLHDLVEGSIARLPSGHRPRVVLAGLPNAGKSTLFNCLTKSSQAIASSLAGTTRDYLASELRINGVTMELIDTAGWESAADGIGKHAQGLRKEQLDASDLVLWCTAADLSFEERAADRSLRAAWDQQSIPVLEVITCIDRFGTSAHACDELQVSAQTGQGLDALRERMTDKLGKSASSRAEVKATTSVRCRDSLKRTEASIKAAITGAEAGNGDEIIAVDLREALGHLRSLLGETYTDDILDHIFSSFCIGK